MKQQRSRDKKELMAEVAAQLLIKEGPSAITHRNIAEAAGLPAGSGNYYYPSKAELYRTAVQRAEDFRAAKAMEKARSVSPQKTPEATAHELLEVLFAPGLTARVVEVRLIPMLDAYKDPILQEIMRKHAPLLRAATAVAFERATGTEIDDQTADLVSNLLSSSLLFAGTVGYTDPADYAVKQCALLIEKLSK